MVKENRITNIKIKILISKKFLPLELIRYKHTKYRHRSL